MALTDQRISSLERSLSNLAAQLGALQVQSRQSVSTGRKSGGGPVGPTVSTAPTPIATGCVLFTFQTRPPEGWLLCDGTEQDLADFPELFAVIGFTFGAPTVAGRFKLPTASDLGGLLHASGMWVIRV